MKNRVSDPARRTCYNCEGQGKVFAGSPHGGYPDVENIITCPICKGSGKRQFSRKKFNPREQGELF